MLIHDPSSSYSFSLSLATLVTSNSIFPSVSGFYHLAYCLLCSSMVLHVLEVLSFFKHTIYTHYILFIHSSINGHCTISTFWLLCLIIFIIRQKSINSSKYLHRVTTESVFFKQMNKILAKKFFASSKLKVTKYRKWRKHYKLSKKWKHKAIINIFLYITETIQICYKWIF